MTRSPFFSVVIPTYNCAKLLERALSSVLTQTFQDFEIIVVDNSSTDDTHQVLKAKDDPRMSVVGVQNHGNIAYSRNIGIHRSKGDWIAFLDSDDAWLPEKLETVRAAILGNPDIILVCHDEWKVVEGKREKYLRHAPSDSDIYESFLFHGSCLSTSAVTLRGDIATKTGGFSERKDFVTAEDYEYWVRLSREGAFHFINKVLGEWHIHGSNLSKNMEIHASARVCVYDHHLGLWLKEHPDLKIKAQKRRARVWAGSSFALSKAHMYSNARKYALRAISLYPFDWKAWAALILSVVHFPIKYS